MESPQSRLAGVQTVLAFDRDRLERVLRFLGEARFTGLVTHLFGIRAFFPDAVGTGAEHELQEVRETLRETLDRLFIKLRLPNYVIAPRDLETAAGRAALESLLGRIVAAQAPSETAGSIVLRGSCDEEESRAVRSRLSQSPIATALPWSSMARLIPAGGEALANYRGLIVGALDELAGADETAFIDALQRRPYPVLDAALDIVRTQLAHAAA